MRLFATKSAGGAWADIEVFRCVNDIASIGEGVVLRGRFDSFGDWPEFASRGPLKPLACASGLRGLFLA